jgi:hypothetical protein
VEWTVPIHWIQVDPASFSRWLAGVHGYTRSGWSGAVVYEHPRARRTPEGSLIAGYLGAELDDGRVFVPPELAPDMAAS